MMLSFSFPKLGHDQHSFLLDFSSLDNHSHGESESVGGFFWVETNGSNPLQDIMLPKCATFKIQPGKLA
jgi:hypothetical protein